MEFDVRVILVGRTGLDAKLRLDPSVELVRVRSPLEAIGELSDPIEGYSPSRAVVIVGVDIYVEPNEPARDAHADFTLHGTAAADFARALRLVDPGVRIFRVAMPSAGHVAPAAPGIIGGATYYDGVINADLPSETIRQIVHRREMTTERPSESPMVEHPPPTQTPSQTSAEPLERSSGQTSGDLSTDPVLSPPEPVVAPEQPAAPQEAPSRSGPSDPEVGDAELVRLSLRGGEILPAALRIVRTRMDDPGIALADAPGAGPHALVECDGVRFGYLVASRSDGTALESQASWLGSWLRLAQQQAQLREAAFTDPLTGAWNRRYFDKFLAAAIDRARTGRQSVTLMLFDIDNFKQYNDRYGHAAADDILIETVRLLRSTIRPSDRVCRIGGDEFAVIFHEPAGPRVPGSTPPSSVFTITKRFQEQIRERKFPKLGIEAPGALTISGGLATFPWDGTSVGDLLRRADELAMESKRSGKNAIMFGPGAARAGPGE